MRIFIGVLLLSLTLITVNGLYQYSARTGFIRGWPITDGRVISSFKHANDFGGYLVLLIPFVFMLSSLGKFLTQKKNKLAFEPTKLKIFLNSNAFKGLMTLLFLGTLTCLGLTYSRAAWLALIAGIVYLARSNLKFLLMVACATGLFAAVFIPKMMAERQSNVVNEHGFFTTSDREMYWQCALQVIQKRPIHGFGLNTYSLVARDMNLKWKGYPHNCYLQIMAEIGIIGLAAFLWTFWRLFWTSHQFLKRADPGFFYDALSGLLAGWLAYLAHSFLDTNFYSVQLDGLMWCLMGLMMAIIQKNGVVSHKMPYTNTL